MPSIDKRVVDLEFNNSQFMQGTKDTLGALKQMNEALAFKNGGKGFGDIQAAASKLNLSNIEAALTNVSSKFNAFGAIGLSVLNNLTTAAMGFAKNLYNNTLGQITQGGMQRAINLEQAEFMFKGLFKDATKTKQAMDDANWAVQGTAFGLDVAAKAGANLAASGVALGDPMKTALRGIAGVAAQTSSSYEEVSDIFMTVAGNGRVMNSELTRLGQRGMNAAAELVKYYEEVHGIAGLTQEDIRDLAAKGQISFEDFAAAMDRAFGENAQNANELYTGSLSNLRTALSRLGAISAEAKIDDMRDIFNALIPKVKEFTKAVEPAIKAYNAIRHEGAQKLIEMIGDLDMAPIRAAIPDISAIMNHLVGFVKLVAEPLKAAFKDIFPADFPNVLAIVASALSNLTSSMNMAVLNNGPQLQRIFAGVFAVFDIGWMAIKAVATAIGDVVSRLTGFGSGFINASASFGDFLVGLRDLIKEGQLFDKIFSTIGGAVSGVIAIFGAFFGILADIVGISTTGVDEALGSMRNRMEALGQIGNVILTVFNFLRGIFEQVYPYFEQMFEGLKRGFENLWTRLIEIVSGEGEFSFGDLFLALGVAGASGIWFGIRALLDSITGVFEGVGGIVDQISNLFQTVTNLLVEMTAQVKAESLLKIAIALGVLALAILILATIDPAALGIALGGVAVMMGEIVGMLALLEKISNSKLSGKASMAATVAGILAISVAMLILSAAVKNLGTMDLDDLGKGLGAVLVLMAAMDIFAERMDKVKVKPSSMAALIGMSIAIMILANAVEKLGSLDIATLVKGGIAVAAIFVLFDVFNDNTADSGKLLAGAAAMLIISAAMNVLAAAIGKFGAMDVNTLVKGFAALAVGLAVMTVAINLMPDPVKSLAGAAGILIVSAAMNLIAGVVERMSGLTWGDVAKGIVVMAAALAMMAVTLSLMRVDSIVGAAAIVLVAIALGMLAPVLVTFSNMSWGGIAKGLLMLAGTFLVLGLGSVLLIPLAVVLPLVGLGLLLLGTGALLAGKGLMLAAGAIALLATTGAAGLTVFGAAMAALAESLPMIGNALGTAFVQFVVGVAENIPILVEAIKDIILALLAAINEIAPEVVLTLVNLILMGIAAIRVLAPEFAELGWFLIQTFLDSANNNIEGITNTAIDIIVKFMGAIQERLPEITNQGADLVIAFINSVAETIRTRSGEIGAAAANLGTALVEGFANAITDAGGVIWAKAKALASSALEAIRSTIESKSPSKKTYELGTYFVEGFANAITDGKPDADRSARALGTQALDSLRGAMGDISDALDVNANFTPTITPTLDLSRVRQGANGIGAIFDNALDPSAIAASRLGTNSNRGGSVITENKTTNVTYNQTNVSPKPLPHLDIYRNTRSQLIKFKEAVAR